MSKNIIIPAIFIILLILTLIFSSLSSIAQGHPGGTPPGGGEQTGTIEFNNEYCNVGQTWEATIDKQLVGLTIIKMEFMLMWTDDENVGNSESQPDTFSLQTHDEMHKPKSDQGSGGGIAISWDEEEDERLNNVWNIAVVCESAGPTDVPVFENGLGIITQPESDPGNSWTLVATYTYTEGGGPGGPPANVVEVLNSPIFKIHIALMIASTFIFLFTGVFAGVFLATKNRWKGSSNYFQKIFAKPTIMYLLVIFGFIAFFIAAVPIGMWVAGMFYGWSKAWTGFPALWNPEAFSFTNADNVSFIVLLLWAIPIYLNRSSLMRNKWYKKLFGWSKFMMSRAEKAPDPKLQLRELALCYFFMGFLIYLVFMVQPHGSG